MKRFLFFVLISGFMFSVLAAETPTIDQKTAGMKKHPGYFPFYWDEEAGKVWLEIDKWDTEFLYVSSLSAGMGSNALGLDGRQLGDTHIVTFQRTGPKVFLVQHNTSFRALSDNPAERRAVEEAFAKSVLWGFPVAAEQEERILVDATPFLLQDAHNVAGRLQRADQGQYRLEPARSAAYLPRTRNFSMNTEFEMLLTFTCSNPGRLVRSVVPHAGAVTVRQHHSFIKLPDSEYQPRVYDPRSNFSAMTYMDFSTPIDQPITKRYIARHRLKKKDPTAEVSDPVEPIIYYVDRGVPEPIRSALIEGAGWWNQAFEAIGYRNAFQVEVLPEGADPMDIRYNMINWVHRSSRGWSYGSRVTDPRTGEILKGHVALGSQRVRQDFLIAQGLVGVYQQGKKNTSPMVEMALARIRQLSCHEVGHTLGLGHNYASSVNNRASVMDYPHPLVKVGEDGALELSEAYDTGIGEWDKVSIAYGYQDFPPGVDEKKELKAILNKAFSRGLYFLAGQDAGPSSAHPLANTWDNGRNPVDELKRMIRIRSLALSRFSEKNIPVGTPMATLEDVLVPVYLFHRYQVEAAASTLGGLYYNHRLRGDVQKNPEIVPAAEQWRALDVLLSTIHPEFLSLDQRILDILPPRPPGYRQTRELFPGHTGSTFDPLGAAEAGAHITLRLILHPERAARLVDYHSRNTDYPGLVDVLDRIINFTWKSSPSTSRHAEIQRVVNNILLIHLMNLAADEESAPQVRAIAFWKLEELKKWIAENVQSLEKGKEETRDVGQLAHLDYALSQIKRFQKEPQKIMLPSPLSPPPGAPIGVFSPNR